MSALPRLLIYLAATVVLSGGTFAADLPTHKPAPPPPPPAPPPAFTWTGFYGGVQGGYSWDGEEIYTTTWSHGLGRSGPYGGLDVGYNYQINYFVLGAEAEYNLSDIRGSVSPLPTYTISTRVDSFGSLDGHLGFTPFDRFMIFGLGGLASADIHHTITLTGLEQDNFRAYEWGYDYGVGVAYAVTNQITVSADYRHYNFGNENFASVGLLGPHYTHENLSSFLVGISYNFGK
jgi:outer membrane immunogenic protein